MIIRNRMKILHLFDWNSQGKLIPVICCLLLFIGCNQSGIDPEVRIGLIVVIALISFVAIFIKPVVGVYIVAIISTIFSPKFNIGFANLYFHQWVILVALLASVSSGLVRGDFHTVIKSNLNIPLMVFIASLLLSLGHAPNMTEGIKSFLFIGVLFASFYLVILSITTVQQIRKFTVLLIIATSLICLLSLALLGSGRLGSLVLRNPNSFGNFLALVIPFSVSLFVFGRFERGKKLLIACSVILMLISLVLTFSRSAWFGVIVSIFCLCVLKPRAPLFLLIFGIISGVFLFAPVKKRVFKDISDPGAQYRIIKAKIALDKFKENPLLGSGLGSFHYEAQFSELWAYRAHSTLENNYLVLLAEGGLIELFAFLYLIIMLGKKVLFLLKRIQDPFLYAILFGCAASIISTMSAGLFEDTLFFPKNNWLIGMSMGIVIIVERIYEESLIAAKTAGVEAEGKEQPFQIKES